MLNSFLVRQARDRNEFGYPKGSYTPAIILAIVVLIFLTIVATGAFSAPIMPIHASLPFIEQQRSNKITIIYGTASWYGGKEDKTDPWPHTVSANGQRFNERALTAASWQFPFGTRVYVKNLDNGKSVIVTITDRGPGKKLVKKGRIIDLSRGAFERIADLKTGVIRVMIGKV